jgi:cleavage and polyadenylation specificity factor subunit 1
MPLRACSNIDGYSTVFLPGASPSFIIKSSKSIPRVVGLKGLGVRALSTFHTEGCDRGFIYADSDGIARVCELPDNQNIGEIGICVERIPQNIDVDSVAFHPPTGLYAVGATVKEEFDISQLDEPRSDRPEWTKENLTFKPLVDRGLLRLINPATWIVIDEVQLEPAEIAVCVKTLNLEVSEATNERRQLIVVGTATSRGEDLPIKGRILVYDIVTVIPQPGRPEKNKRLKVIAKEELPRGAVTAISEIGNQGWMLVAQGQKCLVRGIKEDGSLIPVAFLDMNCYVTCAKELPGSSLCIMADAFRGVWLTGYTEEPYKFMLFGKSSTKLSAVNADLLPDHRQLYVFVADMDGNIHILQYDPERKSNSSTQAARLHTDIRKSQTSNRSKATSFSTARPSAPVPTHQLTLYSSPPLLPPPNPPPTPCHGSTYSLPPRPACSPPSPTSPKPTIAAWPRSPRNSPPRSRTLQASTPRATARQPALPRNEARPLSMTPLSRARSSTAHCLGAGLS